MSENERLPGMIVGALPSPEALTKHRLLYKTARMGTVSGECSCGWSSGPCSDDQTFMTIWKGHKV